MGVMHRVAEAEFRRWEGDEVNISFGPVEGLRYADDPAGLALCLQPCAFQKLDEQFRASVGCGNFRSIHFDASVIDAVCIQRRQQVFDHHDAPFFRGQSGGAGNFSNIVQPGGNQRLFGEIDALEDESGIGLSGANLKSGLFSGEKTNTGSDCFALECFLHFGDVDTGQSTPLGGQNKMAKKANQTES